MNDAENKLVELSELPFEGLGGFYTFEIPPSRAAEFFHPNEGVRLSALIDLSEITRECFDAASE